MRITLLGALVAGFVCIGTTAAAAPLRVAMLPVVVNSNTGETEYLSSGIADMLSARLEQTGEIAIVRLDTGSTDRDAAVKAASEVNASFVVFGSYTQFGDGASLDVRCAQVDGTDKDGTRRVFIQAGTPGDIIPKLDDLSLRMTRYLVGASVSAPPPSDGPPSPAVKSAPQPSGDLERRVAELERVIFNRAPADEADR